MSFLNSRSANDNPNNSTDNYSPPDPEKFGALTLILSITIFVHALTLIRIGLWYQTDLRLFSFGDVTNTDILIQAVISAFAISFALLLWNNIRWGIYGLIVVFLAALVLSLMHGSMPISALNLLVVVGLAYISRNLDDYLE